MCLILKLPAGDTLTDAEILDVHRRNPDGFGAVWHDATGSVRTLRTMPRKPADAIRDFRLARDASPGEMWLHWRMATHGVVSLEMAHPFRLPGGVALVHNGVFASWGDHERSDTAELCQDILTPYIAQYGPAVLGSDAFRQWAEKHLKGSAVVMFGPDGAVHRFGNAGLAIGERWYSNTYAWSAPGQSRWYGSWRGVDYTANDDDDFDAEYLDACLYQPGLICAGGRSDLLSTLSRLVSGYDRQLARDLSEDLLLEDRWSHYADHLIEQAIEILQATTDLELWLTESGELWAVEVDDTHDTRDQFDRT
jgi:hypothetical protein